MNRKVIINGVTYETEKIQAPLADDPSQMAVFPDTSDATADPASVKDGETFYADGEKKEGSMPVNGDVSGTISTKDGTVAIPAGHTTGGTVGLSSTEKAKLIPGNIRQGVTVLGVTGAMSPSEGVNAQSKTVTPDKSQQVVQPDPGYTHLAQVIVGAIPAEYVTTTDANAVAADLTKGKTAYVNGKKVTGTHTDPSFSVANGVLTIK
jgi:hypothetical protein